MILHVEDNELVVIGEALVGYFSNSLALLSDAGHYFADALALVVSCHCVRIAQRPSSAKRTYGHNRVGILIALVNSLSLVLIAPFNFLGGHLTLPSA